MDSRRVHDRARYRCRHGHTNARTRLDGAPRALYLREDHLLARIGEHLTQAGIATNLTSKQVARLVQQLDLAFRCDPGTITLLEQPSTTQRPRTPRCHAIEPEPQQHIPEPLPPQHRRRHHQRRDQD